jgi:hypothetical protein
VCVCETHSIERLRCVCVYVVIGNTFYRNVEVCVCMSVVWCVRVCVFLSTLCDPC